MPLLEDYVDNSFPVEVGPEWSLETIRNAIGNRPHYSTLSPESIAFCRKEILERTRWGFSIVLSDTNDITLFGASLRISPLASVDQVNRKPRLICNSIKEPDAATLPVKASTYIGTAPKEIQFGAFLVRLLQQIWDANPVDGPFWMSKWGILDVFHWCNLRLSNVGNFAYVVAPLPTDPSFLL